MESWKSALLGGTALLGAGLLVAPKIAEAQTAALPGGVVAVQQSAARADAASFMAMPNNGNTACGASQASVANLTITVTPPAGNFVYLTGVNINVADSNTTGSTSTVTWTATNLNTNGVAGNVAWETTASAGTGQAVPTGVNEVYPTGLKSISPGGTVVLTPSATMASAIQCPHAYGFFSPL